MRRDSPLQDPFSQEVVARRFNEVVRRMVNTPPKPHAEVKHPGPGKAKQAASDRKTRKNGAGAAAYPTGDFDPAARYQRPANAPLPLLQPPCRNASADSGRERFEVRLRSVLCHWRGAGAAFQGSRGGRGTGRWIARQHVGLERW
jgi:hypothetical protein